MSKVDRGFHLVATMTVLSCCLSGEKAKQSVLKDDVEQRQVAFWTGLKKALIAPDGDRYFEYNVRDVEIPGGAAGLQFLRGTIVSLDLGAAKRKMVLALSDGTTSEVTLYLSSAVLDVETRFHMGQKVEVKGVAREFQKDPFMLRLLDGEVRELEERKK